MYNFACVSRLRRCCLKTIVKMQILRIKDCSKRSNFKRKYFMQVSKLRIESEILCADVKIRELSRQGNCMDVLCIDKKTVCISVKIRQASTFYPQEKQYCDKNIFKWKIYWYMQMLLKCCYCSIWKRSLGHGSCGIVCERNVAFHERQASSRSCWRSRDLRAFVRVLHAVRDVRGEQVETSHVKLRDDTK